MLKVLYIGNDREQTDDICKSLEEQGYDVCAGYSGKQGIYLFRGFLPDIIFLDLDISDMNGEDVLKQMKLESKDSAFITVSGSKMEDHVRFNLQVLNLKERGADGFLIKPVIIEGIIRKIREILESKKIVR